MLSIPKISLGQSLKTYTHDLSFDNNTTMSIGVVQPLMCQFLSDKDSVSVDLRQLVRLAPMPVPSFARLSLVNKVKFVRMSDVFRDFDALMSHTRVSTVDNGSYIPTSVPTITNRFLVSVLCMLSDTQVTLYMGSPLKQTPMQTPSETLYKRYFTDVPVLSAAACNNSSDVTPLNADYVLSKSSSEYYCVRLGRLGRILRSAFVGLGYALNVSDRDPLSVLPIFALYRAYFDSYSPLRDTNWTDTACFYLIDFVHERATTNLLSGAMSRPKLSDFFIGELANLFATYDDDFLSVHRLDPNLAEVSSLDGQLKQPSSGMSQINSIGTSNDGKLLTSPNTSDDASAPFTLLTMQTLQRLQRYINKDSIIGKKVSNWLKVHFGADVESDYFKDSFNVADIVTRCDINDVFSTADTTGSNGDYLGAYGGKGLGFNQSGFKFRASGFGYLIILGSIIPKNGFYQGNDPTLYAHDRFTYPSADFDALGYELTPFGVVRDDGGTDLVQSTKSFGFIPRFSGFKIKKDIVNGDMSRVPTRAELSSYHLDRLLSTPSYSFVKNDDGSVNISPSGKGDIPSASLSWRYVSRYPWLGNYGRIFYNDTDNFPNKSPYDVDDQFIVQTVFDVKVTNKLKPISDSFDTYDKDSDNASTSVNAE